MIGIVIFTLRPLLREDNRTKSNIRGAIVNVLIVFSIIISVLIFKVSFSLAMLGGFIAIIILDSETYTKKRLITYGSIILVVIIVGTIIFRDNPDYVLDHLKDHPKTILLYVSENGEEMITY